jgi:hypothetical protein
MLTLISAVAPSSSNPIYVVLYVLLGVGALAGTSGVYGLWRYAKNAGKRDAKIDDAVNAILDPETGHAASTALLTDHSRDLATIKRSISPNGLNTQSLGDVAARVERDVKSIRTQLDRHVGASDETHREIRHRIGALERKPS